ncbi:UNVERIFIED_CONTAM: hypothetical protein Sradi_7238000 [Sesamum radiatum]|uniref:Uncharacterized protein n=1 Tax=Sesamum radiatum TaxID=300843 RepID=A0AAW2INK9_SESRA
MEEPRPAATASFPNQSPADGAVQGQQQSQTEAPASAETAARTVPGQKRSYARTVQQPLRRIFSTIL